MLQRSFSCYNMLFDEYYFKKLGSVFTMLEHACYHVTTRYLNDYIMF